MVFAWSSPETLGAHDAVDRLAEQVGMAVVPSVFLDHMHQHPAHGRASGARRIAPQRVEIAERGDYSTGMRTLCPPGGKRLSHIGRVDVIKGAIGVMLGAVMRWRVLIGERATKPAAFDL